MDGKFFWTGVDALTAILLAHAADMDGEELTSSSRPDPVTQMWHRERPRLTAAADGAPRRGPSAIAPNFRRSGRGKSLSEAVIRFAVPVT